MEMRPRFSALSQQNHLFFYEIKNDDGNLETLGKLLILQYGRG